MHFSSRSLLAGAAVGLTLSLSLAAQHPRCKTPSRDLLRPAPDNPSDCAYSSTTPAGQYATISVYRIPVVFHVIRTTGGNGNISAAQIQNQVDILNEDFRALAGTPGASANPILAISPARRLISAGLPAPSTTTRSALAHRR